MEFLYRQMRGKLSSVDDDTEEEKRSVRDKRMQPQKTQSFKGEKKKTSSWLQKQFSRQMSRDSSRTGDDYPAAVAATAFAIKALEEERNIARQMESQGQDTTLAKVPSKLEDKTRKLADQPSRTKSDVSDKRAPTRGPTQVIDIATSGPASSKPKTKSFRDHLSEPDNAVPGKAIGPAPSKTSTFGDRILENGAGSGLGTAPSKPSLPPTKDAGTSRPSLTKPGTYSTEADEWEKAEMAKIKEKYDKLETTIHNWENKKKTKAKRHLDKIEADLDKRRAKSTHQYREKIARIDNIAGGAKAQAEENRRNEESKVKEKANKIRLTGKLPGACLCF